MSDRLVFGLNTCPRFKLYQAAIKSSSTFTIFKCNLVSTVTKAKIDNENLRSVTLVQDFEIQRLRLE